MDAVKYLKEQARMCDSFGDDCDGCPLWGKDCGRADGTGAEQKVEAVEKWSNEHLQKTRMSELQKIFPNAEMCECGVPDCCPQYMEKEWKCMKVCSECKTKYWLEEIE